MKIVNTVELNEEDIEVATKFMKLIDNISDIIGRTAWTDMANIAISFVDNSEYKDGEIYVHHSFRINHYIDEIKEKEE